MLREGTAPLVQRADYTAPAFWIDIVRVLKFVEQDKERTILRRCK